jgi:hypothetical protein
MIWSLARLCRTGVRYYQWPRTKKGSIDAIASIPLEPVFREDRPLRLDMGIPGHLDTLAFIDGQESQEALTHVLVGITPRAYGVCWNR